MSLDFSLLNRIEVKCIGCNTVNYVGTGEVIFERNITHNLNKMFARAQLYEILWRGDGLIAGEVIGVLEKGLADMVNNPNFYKMFEAKNGWGTYDSAIAFLEGVLDACKLNPHCVISCCR